MTRTAPFSAKAIRNACLASVFAVAPIGLAGLYVIGSVVDPQGMKVAQEEVKARNAEMTPAKLVRAAKRQNLGYKCKSAIQAQLKDPNSYRELNREYLVPSLKEVSVRLTYTATNSFGGRIQNTQSCNYTL